MPPGRLTLIDEVLTPDSSRFWPADTYRAGASPPSFDKQFVRDYLETLDWNKQAPGPEAAADDHRAHQREVPRGAGAAHRPERVRSKLDAWQQPMQPLDRPLDSVRRLRPPRRGSRCGAGGRRRSHPLRRDGQSLRARISPSARWCARRCASTACTAPIDVHLMVRPVDRIVPDFAAAGATYISFHPEATEHVDRTIALIREHGCRPGLVFNPATPLDYLDYTLDNLDMVLIMSVNPGFGGQKFIPTSLRKLARCAARASRPAGARCGWRSTAGSRSITSAPSPPRGRRHLRRGLGDLRQPDYAATIVRCAAQIAGITRARARARAARDSSVRRPGARRARYV